MHFWIVADGHDLQMSGYPTKVRELSLGPDGALPGDRRQLIRHRLGLRRSGAGRDTPESARLAHDYVSAVAFQRQGTAQALLASGGLDARLALWRAEKSRKAPLAMAEMSAPVSQLAWSPDDTCLAAGDAAGSVQLYGVRG